MMLRTWTLKSLAAAVTLAAACSVASFATAALIVNDTWKDGTDSDPASPTFSENSTDSDADGDIESAWFFGGAGTLDPIAANGPLRGTTGGSSSSWTTYFTPEGSEVNLAQGHQLKLTWVFTPGGTITANTSQGFRIALTDSPSGSRVTGNNASPGSAAYTGYAIFGNMAPTLGNSNPFQLRERVVASGAFLGTANQWGANGVADVGLANGATTGNTGYVAGTQYTLTALLTRTPLDELQVDISIAGGSLNGTGLASVSYLDASPNGFKYDTFALRPSTDITTASQFDTSLFRVELIVPEPASLALVGLAGVLFAGLGRRRS